MGVWVYRFKTRKIGEAGLTIIETMIVLAIAAVILMIVFEAIPALERNSRNNQRRQDVQAVLGAVSQYELNNSGNMPSSGSPLKLPKLSFYYSPVINYYDLSSSACPNPMGITGVAINFCMAGDWTKTPASVAGITNPTVMVVYNHQKCDQVTPGKATRSGAGFRDVVAMYGVESGGHITPQCQQL